MSDLSLNLQDAIQPPAPGGPDFLDAIQGRPVEPINPGEVAQSILDSGAIEKPVEPKPEGYKPPLWHRVAYYGLSTLADILEPLYVLEGPRALAMDISGEEPGAFRKWLGNLKYIVPGGAKPENIKSFRDVLAKRGVDGWIASVVGTFLDMGYDPANWLFAGEGITRKLAANALKDIAPESARAISRLRWDDIRRIAEQMPDGAVKEQLLVASRIRRAGEFLQPAELMKAVVPESVRTTLVKKAIEFVDLNKLWRGNKLPGVIYRKVVKPRRLATGSNEVVPPIQAFVEEPTYWRLRSAGTPHEQIVKELLGYADVTSPASAVAGIKTKARVMAQHLRAATQAASEDIVAAFESSFGIKPSENVVLYNTVDKLLAEIADKVGPGLATDIIDVARKTFSPPAVKELLAERLPKDYLRQQAGKAVKNLDERVKRLAKAYNVPEEKVWNFLEQGARSIWSFHAVAGYYLSGMNVLDDVIHEVWKDLQKDVSRLKTIGVKNFDEFRTAAYRQIADQYLKKAFPNSAPEGDEVAKWVIAQRVKDKYNEVVAPVAAVPFEDYIGSLFKGYLRRVVPFVGPAGEERVLQALATPGGTWYVGKQVAAEEVINAVQNVFGKEKADRLAAILFARGDSAISLDELSKFLGGDVEQIAKLLEEAGIAPIDLSKFVKTAGKSLSKDVAAFAIGKKKWQERVLPEEQLFVEYLGHLGATARLEAYGRAAARSISSQEIVRQTYDLLSQAGMIKDGEQLFVKGHKLIDEWGIDYMHIPDNKDDWGPLAGKYIPRYAAEPILRALELNDPTTWQEFVQFWRGVALSSPDTVARNVGSGLIQMAQAGMPISQMPRYLFRAIDALKKLRKGDFSSIGPGIRALQIYGEGKLYGEALDSFERDLMKSIGLFQDQPKRILERMREALQNPKYAKVNPLLWFEYSEDLMRTASFLWFRDTLLKAGFSAKEAGEKAAAIANHILFNYAEQPYAFNVLKQNGWLLFPAFPYYNIARTAMLMAKRPWAVSNVQHIYEGIRAGVHGGPEEDRRRMRMVYGTYLYNQMPIIVPYKGHYLVVPLAQYIPTAATEPVGTVSDMISGGILSPLISATYAIMLRQNPPWEDKYGVKYVPPIESANLLERIAAAGKTAIGQAVPGLPRRVGTLAQALYNKSVGITPDAFLEVYGKTGKKTLDESLLNFLFSAREIGPAYSTRALNAKIQRCVDIYRKITPDAMRLIAAGQEERARSLLQRAVNDSRRCIEGVYRGE